jgi:hypothetical protein
VKKLINHPAEVVAEMVEGWRPPSPDARPVAVVSGDGNELPAECVVDSLDV